MKSHRSHDVVLLCFDCLSRALSAQDRLKKELAEQYDAPLREISPFFTLNHHVVAMQRISKTLTSCWEKIPPERRANLLRAMYEGAEFCVSLQKEAGICELVPEQLAKQDHKNLEHTFQLLNHCLEKEFQPIRLSNSQKTNPHGEKVTKAILGRCQDGDFVELEEFVRTWRRHF